MVLLVKQQCKKNPQTDRKIQNLLLQNKEWDNPHVENRVQKGNSEIKALLDLIQHLSEKTNMGFLWFAAQFTGIGNECVLPACMHQLYKIFQLIILLI
jgi:hypothetical protein